jgi:hypothetical protein
MTDVELQQEVAVEHLPCLQDRSPEFKPQYCQKRKKHFWAGGVAQALDCLPTKCEALSSNSNITKREEKKKKPGGKQQNWSLLS